MKGLKDGPPLVPGTFVLLLLLGVASGGSARSGSDDSPPRMVPGRSSLDPVPSFWGVLPDPADSVTGRFRTPRLPLWERSLLLPYHVAALPVRAAVGIARVTFIVLDDHHLIDRIGGWAGPLSEPPGVALNFRAGGMAGTGGGLSILRGARSGPHAATKLRFQATTKGSRTLTLGIRLPHHARLVEEFCAGHRLTPNATYFGMGPDANKSDGALYNQEISWFALNHTILLSSVMAADAALIYSSAGARKSSHTDYPPLTERFAADIPDGYGHRSDGISMSLSLRRDGTVDDARPNHGGGERAMVSVFQNAGGAQVSYWTYRLEGERFIPVSRDNRVLAVKGFFSRMGPTTGRRIPFQRLLTNDDPDLFRGYEDLRWRDRGITALTIEYRWPIWALRTAAGPGLDAYLFSDLGQVFGAAREISMGHLTRSYGLGARLIRGSGFAGRLEVARSEERTMLRLRAEQVFQRTRGRLYDGRSPIPIR